MNAAPTRPMAPAPTAFPRLNRAYGSTFRFGRLSVGLTVPIAAYPDSDVPDAPDVAAQLARVQRAEQGGFAAVWLRDVPFRVPSFGDAGHVHDPWVLLGLLAGQTTRIGLGVASIVLPLRHPAHVAKAAASVDVLSEGRMLLGVASGDRPAEFPAMGWVHADRGERFREAYTAIRALGQPWGEHDGSFGRPRGVDLLPKPTGPRLPMLITGGSQQSPPWLAQNGDGWMTYPRPAPVQAAFVERVRDAGRAAGQPERPVMQPLYVDLLDNDGARPAPIHLGWRTGIGFLRDHLHELEAAGVNHVALNLRFHRGGIDRALDRLGDALLPAFPAAD